MIDEIVLDQFQGFGRRQTIPLKPLTLIYGPNAAGKSSILRALRLLNQSVLAGAGRPSLSQNRAGTGSFVFDGEDISMASFQNTVYKHEVSEAGGVLLPMTIGCTMRLEATPSNRSSDWHFWFRAVTVEWSSVSPGAIRDISLMFHSRQSGLENVRILFDVDPLGGQAHPSSFSGEETLRSIHLGRGRPTSAEEANMASPDLLIAMEAEEDYASSFDSSWENYILEQAHFQMSSLIPRVRQGARNSSNGSPYGRFPGNPTSMDRQFRFLNELLSLPIQLLNRQARGTGYVGPLRKIEQRLNFVQATESFTDPDDRQGEPGGQENQDPRLSGWLERLTDGRYSFRRVEFTSEEIGIFGALQADFIYDNFTKTQVSFQDVGVGLSQVMPILRSLIAMKPGSAVSKALLIEQPELHLHPKMQFNLADLLIDAATRRGVQIVAETHSEAFLLRVQKQLREGTLDPSDVQVLYVDNEGDSNVIREIPLERSSDFDAELPISFASLRLSEYL